jgi:hypothetical protein
MVRGHLYRPRPDTRRTIHVRMADQDQIGAGGGERQASGVGVQEM